MKNENKWNDKKKRYYEGTLNSDKKEVEYGNETKLKIIWTCEIN